MHAITAAKGLDLSSEVTERILTIMRSMLQRGEVTRHGEAPHVVWMLNNT